MLLCGRGICTGTFAICRALDGRASANVSVAIVASLVGAGCLLGGIVLGIVRRVPLALGLQTAGVVLLGVAGVVLLVGGESVGAGFRSEVEPALGLDPLSGFFVVVLGVVAVPALAYARNSIPATAAGGAMAALTGGFVLAMAGLLAARDVSVFLACWELMTLLPAAAILLYARDAGVRRAVFVYLAVTHIGGVGVWVALLTLASHGAIGGVPVAGGLQALVAIAALVGFATKAGVMPFHVWLPRAHPVAPPHLSALMSGVMIELALYGLVRVLFEWLAPAPLWVGLLLLALGGLSALGGVVYALMQHELKRLLAFSSIENVGIVVLALGASLVLASRGETTWSALAFGAALLHVLNHAVFKAALFLGAGAIAHRVGSLELDRLGGLLRRMPWTAAGFAVAAMAIAGLPPLNGFASEWLTLQSLARLPLGQTDGTALVVAAALAALGATAALAVLCFVKVIGLVLLGEPRRPECETASEPPAGMRGAVVGLAALCVALGPAAGLILPRLVELAPGTVELRPAAEIAAPGTGSLPTLALTLALAAAILGLRRLRGTRRAPAAPVWASGQRAAPSLAWTSAGFTKTLRLALEGLLRPRREVETQVRGGVLLAITYRGAVPHLFDTRLYGPFERTAMRSARRARRLQSGNLRAYLLYLVVLVLGMLALVRAGVIG